MKLKLLGPAVAAALLGLSTASFGDAGGSAGSGPSGQDNAKSQSAPAASSGSAVGSGTASGSATTGSSMSSDCDKLTGSARTRCERQHSSTSGSSTTPGGAPITKEPAQSGPGTVDRDAKGKPSGGTNSAGSN